MQVNFDKNINFSSRCIPIRAGQQACLTISKELPHTSSTQIWYRVFKNEKYALKFIDVAYFAERLARYYRKKFFTMEFNQYARMINSVRILQEGKIGNCNEVSDVAAMILRKNGYNAGVTEIKHGDKYANHFVCVFNRDNKPVDKITKNTIIVDSWLGECDFAQNIFKKYEGEYSHIFKKRMHVKTLENQKFGIGRVNYFNMTENEEKMLAQKYQNLNISDDVKGAYRRSENEYMQENLFTKFIDFIKDVL